MARAYVLITTEVGKAEPVAQALRGRPGVRQVDIVAGTYDVVAVVEGQDANAVGRLVLTEFHGLSGLKSTLTLIALA